MTRTDHFIDVDNLSKSFRVRKRAKGVSGYLLSLLKSEYNVIEAVKDISFSIKKGERVAFIGPNGAGKSTTIKMLTGILHPTSGSALVNGFIPWIDRSKLSFDIGCVFGQRSQLWYHLTAKESFDLLGKIFRVETARYAAVIDRLVDAFQLVPLFEKRVSQMSLGERMRCEVAASLLHSPQVLFLDEPSIGLDIVARLALRDLVKGYSQERGVTVMLTSHDTGDIEGVCDRVILINRGVIVTDCSLTELKRTAVRKKTITIQTQEREILLNKEGLEIKSQEPHRTVVEIDLDTTPVEVGTSYLLATYQVQDLSIQDPPLEQVISALYRR